MLRTGFCVVHRCDNPPRCRGFCRLHYDRWRKTGDPMLTLRDTLREDRFWSRVDAGGDCWEWTGNRNTKGYGRVWWDSGQRPAHRKAYELLIGPIPDGLQIDHLCRNPGCVNPDHLEPVTMQENIRRGAPKGPRRKQNCKRGHPFSGDNLSIDPGSGDRECRTCRRAGQRRRYRERVLRNQEGQ